MKEILICLEPLRINISAISNKIKKAFEIRGISCNTDISAIRLNRMLMESGDLIETAIGKVETKKGRKNGIEGEYRATDSKTYWIAMYGAESQKYVIDLAFTCIPELVVLDLIHPHCFWERADSVETTKEQDAAAESSGERSIYRAAAAKEETPPEISCDTCMLKRREECFGSRTICGDYKHVPFISRDEKKAWPEYGDATAIRVRRREKDNTSAEITADC